MTSRSSSLGMFFLAAALTALLGPAAWAQRTTGNKGDTKGINVEPVLSPKSGQFRALLIGVNDYTRLKDLKYCEADVTALRDRLVAMGFRRDAIKCLTTGDRDPARRPSYRNITEHLDALFSGLKEDAVLVIALSGHGGSFEWKDASGKVQKASFYCPQDARLHDPLRTMISTKDIFDRLEKCPARFKLLLVDACRDAHFAPDGARTAINEAKSMAGFAKSLSDPSTLPKDTLAMISCASGEQSYEDPKLGHGIFMYYVLQGLAGKADVTYRGDRNKIVSYRELADYVYRKTSDHAWAKHTRRQTPKFYAKWEQRDFDLAEVQETDPPKDFTNRIAMKFKLIPAGDFMMSSPGSEKDRDKYEGPLHRVKITKPYYMGVHEVTQREYEKVMGTSPWKGKRYVKEGSDYPASYISWDEAVEFCKKLSAKEGHTYRLPTEAQWEYACRAGSKTAYSFGADSSKLGTYAWYRGNVIDVGEKYAHLVGQKRANAFGLYDMHGNVYEWCADWYHANYFAKSPTNDPKGPSTGFSRVYRGGAWDFNARDCRSAFRYCSSPGDRRFNRGFRVALVPSE